MPPRSVASFAQFSYLLSKGQTWEGNIEGSALWVQYLPPFTTFWPTSLPSLNGWILSSMTDTVETGGSLLLFSCFTTSLPTPSIFSQEMKMYWFYCTGLRTCLRSHLPVAGMVPGRIPQMGRAFLSASFCTLCSLEVSRAPKLHLSGLHQYLDSGWKT